jgi:hypothetical protein
MSSMFWWFGIVGSYLSMGCDFSDTNLTSDLSKMGANLNLGLSL